MFGKVDTSSRNILLKNRQLLKGWKNNVVYDAIIVTPEERKRRNALNAPYFLVALKDTEILLNTYLRFMVKVKGNPNPEVKLWVFF